jgi:hypothetical protein
MFGLFKKKLSEDDAIFHCKRMAAAAAIEPILENGAYSGFLVRIDETGSSLAPYFRFDSARNAFAGEVEDRIQRNDFEQVMPNRAALGLPPRQDDGRRSAVRAVLGQKDVPLMRWNG